MKQDFEKIISFLNEKKLDGFVNITKSVSKDLEYNPLYDEISLDSSENISTKIVIIKENKKAIYSLDGFNLDDIYSAVLELEKVVKYSEFDKDIVLADITDKVEKDFSNDDIKNIGFEDLENEFNKFKNYKLNDLVNIEGFSIGYRDVEHNYINSKGSIKTQIDNSSYYFVELYASSGEISEADYVYKSFKTKPEINLESIKELEEKLLNKISKNDSKLESGNYTISLDREVVVGFLDIILGNMGAESIREGISMFSQNNIGDKIFSDKFTLVNNPELEGYTGNIVFDGEGVTQVKKVLFENGVFKNKFYDYKNALKDGLENLGNSGVSNIELVGDVTNEYLKNSKVLFTNLMAFHTVDSTTGKFSLAGEGYLVENGVKKSFIKNISLSGDIISLFSNIESIGNDFLDYGNFKVPSITFSNQKVI